MNLSPTETRVLGCLLEKQRTTPDMYPLTLNGLRLACNQSTNRDPVVEYDDELIRDALHRLERRGLTRLASGRGRAPKYRHLLAEALPMGPDEQAIVCVLMLRGAQTPGEIKQRAERMHPFGDIHAVHDTLSRLIDRRLAERSERRPGQKEERYRQLLEDPDSAGVASVTGPLAGEAVSYGGAPAASASLDDEPPFLAGALGANETASAAGARGGEERAAAPRLSGVEDTASAAGAPGVEDGASVASAEDGLERRVARLEREVAELREALGS